MMINPRFLTYVLGSNHCHKHTEECAVIGLLLSFWYGTAFLPLQQIIPFEQITQSITKGYKHLKAISKYIWN